MNAAAADAPERLRAIATDALARMRAAGFEHAQVTARRAAKDEVNLAHSEPSLLRSTEKASLALAGIVSGRRAATELSDFDDAAALGARIVALHADATSAPQDPAHAVSSGEHCRIAQGPRQVDLDALAGAAGDLLAFRERESPKTVIDESFVAHNHVVMHTLTSGGSDLACSVGWYEASVVVAARDGARVSSFNFTGGTTDELAGGVVARFGIGTMLRETERQVDATPIGAKFTGDVVLTPNAVVDLIGWLLGQLEDSHLIGGTSQYRDRVGATVASPTLTLHSRFDAPGIAAVSADAFATPPVEVVRAGCLQTLLPSLYGSRKTGLPHVPVAVGGWEVAAGATALAELTGGVDRGARVGRLSMGRPAANGDFSGVIKNSFAIDGGRIGHALSETMITGNVARMFEDIVAVSRERIDGGHWLLPWLRVGGLHFS